MPHYEKLIRDSWEKVKQDYSLHIFKPLNEKDISAYLYHALTCLKQNDTLVNIEYGIGDYKIDLQLLTYKGKELIPILPIEIKETKSSSLDHMSVINRIKKDVNKLSDYKRWLTSNADTKPVVIFFFRGTNGKQLDDNTMNEMGKVQDNYPAILFLWGPY